MSVHSAPVDPASSTPAAPKGSAERPSERQDGDGLQEDGAALLDADGPGGFLGATMAELAKVVWPSRQQLFSESVAVILMVGLSAAAIAAIDRFYGWLSHLVFR